MGLKISGTTRSPTSSRPVKKTTSQMLKSTMSQRGRRMDEADAMTWPDENDFSGGLAPYSTVGLVALGKEDAAVANHRAKQMVGKVVPRKGRADECTCLPGIGEPRFRVGDRCRSGWLAA